MDHIYLYYLINIKFPNYKTKKFIQSAACLVINFFNCQLRITTYHHVDIWSLYIDSFYLPIAEGSVYFDTTILFLIYIVVVLCFGCQSQALTNNAYLDVLL